MKKQISFSLVLRQRIKEHHCELGVQLFIESIIFTTEILLTIDNLKTKQKLEKESDEQKLEFKKDKWEMKIWINRKWRIRRVEPRMKMKN